MGRSRGAAPGARPCKGGRQARAGQGGRQGRQARGGMAHQVGKRLHRHQGGQHEGGACSSSSTSSTQQYMFARPVPVPCFGQHCLQLAGRECEPAADSATGDGTQMAGSTRYTGRSQRASQPSAPVVGTAWPPCWKAPCSLRALMRTGSSSGDICAAQNSAAQQSAAQQSAAQSVRGMKGRLQAQVALAAPTRMHPAHSSCWQVEGGGT